MGNYEIIKKHFDKIDLSFFKSGNILICLDPTDVDFKVNKEHYHDNYI